MKSCTGISHKIVIIGAGPAGLMAAQILASAGHSVVIYDRMPSFGRKFLLAGRGGLNLTHSETFEDFVTRYREAAPHLQAILADFSATNLQNWCHDLGQPTFIGSSGRVFPVCFKTSPLLRAWIGRLASLGVEFRTRHTWLGWSAEDQLVFLSPSGDAISVQADATLLALGGASWPRLGSDGSWTDILRQQGIPVSSLRAANCGFQVAWSPHFQNRFQGEPLKRIQLRFGTETVLGEAFVTANGIEGGAVYALSGPLRDAIDQSGPQILTVDLRPDMPMPVLLQKLEKRKPRSSLSTHLHKAAGLDPVKIGLLREGSADKLIEDPASLAKAIKSVPITIESAFSLDRAISCAGGVKFSSLNNNLMLVARPGVFVAGEMLDWEAPTGGYLLQACFATAFRAANGISRHLELQISQDAGQNSPPVSG